MRSTPMSAFHPKQTLGSLGNGVFDMRSQFADCHVTGDLLPPRTPTTLRLTVLEKWPQVQGVCLFKIGRSASA